MNEVEVKARIDDIDKIMKSLEELGCDFSEQLEQKDKIFLHNSIEFPDIKKGTVILRIRDSNGKCILNLKKQLGNEMDNIEQETEISDSEAGEEILKHLGFHEVVQVNKIRQECKYRDMTICVDEVENLGSFIEVEKLTDEKDSAKLQKELFKFLETLGIKKEYQVFQGYDTLIYNKDK